MISGVIAAALAAAPAPNAAVPSALAPYFRDAQFDPGNYSWLKGAFPEAAAADRRRWRAIARWQEQCFRQAQAQVRADLMAIGIKDPQVPPAPYGDQQCAVVSFYAAARKGQTNFRVFQHDVRTARPLAKSFLFATRLAEQMGGPRGGSLSDKLAARPLAEQMLRVASNWGSGEAKAAPLLSPGVKTIVVAELGAAIAQQDHANTEWLKAIVEKEGWPLRSKVGEHQADFAWLLVQHADLDPVFQVRMLRLMEPLVKTGEVSKQNYAYLFDRVGLKTSGRQRYATQMTCTAGQYVALPLEDQLSLPRLRSEMGLPDVADYVAQMHALSGDCPRD